MVSNTSNENIERLTLLHNEILSCKLGWKKLYNRISKNSQSFGPEMIHVGTQYFSNENPTKIVFIGLNPKYDEYDINTKGFGTPAWIKDISDYENLGIDIRINSEGTNFLNVPLNPSQYYIIRKKYEYEQIQHSNYITGKSDYTYNIKTTVETIFKIFNSEFSLKDIENENRYISSRICWMNLFPVEGIGDCNLTIGKNGSFGKGFNLFNYGHILPALDILRPQIIYLFHTTIYKYFSSKDNPMNLTFFEGDEAYFAKRKDKELWIFGYHFRPGNKKSIDKLNDLKYYGGEIIKKFFKKVP